MAIIWPGLCGKYSFLPARQYRVPADTGEMVSKKALILHGQEIRHLSLDELAKILYPILLMLAGAVMLDRAGRQK